MPTPRSRDDRLVSAAPCGPVLLVRLLSSALRAAKGLLGFLRGLAARGEAERPPGGPRAQPAGPSGAAQGLQRRHKLGLALAGGGFRASLFHLGVLRRMAELDLLRYVEVLSTVSGGSIVGALYILYLKKRLDVAKTLSRDEYVEVVKEVQEALVAGIQQDLRTRLFTNPLGILRVLLTHQSLGRRMARLYERYIYRDIVDTLEPRPWWCRLWGPGRIPLHRVRFSPGGDKVKRGLEAYNRDAVATRGSVITNLILNATALNSGSPFRFSSAEIGDPRLGFFRHDEIATELLPRKALLDTLGEDALRSALNASSSNPAAIGTFTSDRRTISLAVWWRSGHPVAGGIAPAGWDRVFALPLLVDRLAASDFGPLRAAKLPAWYLRRGLTQECPIDGGLSERGHRERFWAAIHAIVLDPEAESTLRKALEADRTLFDLVLDFVLELYYIRSAEVVSPRIAQDLDRITLGEAVGASACFPPVFPPFAVLGIYDDLWVTRLGLTDGGVYDNVGVDTLLSENCTDIIASDTSGLFDVKQRVTSGRLGMTARMIGIFMDDVAAHQRDALRGRRTVSSMLDGIPDDPQGKLQELRVACGLDGLAFFHIDSPPLGGPGLDLGLDRDALARIRTDLDAFSDMEIGALVNHGYDMADRYIRRYLAGSPYATTAFWQPASQRPIQLEHGTKEVNRTLEAGQHRFFRALRLWVPIPWLVIAAAVGFLVWKTSGTELSAQGVRSLIPEALWAAGGSLRVPRFPPWIPHPTTVGGAIVLLVVGIVVLTLLPKPVERLKKAHPRLTRPLLFVLKWARSFALNIFWPVSWKAFAVLLGAISVVTTAFGLAGYWLFHKPLLWWARDGGLRRNDMPPSGGA